MTSRLVPALLSLAALLLAALLGPAPTAVHAGPEDEDGKGKEAAKPAGETFKSPAMGITAQTPEGWKLLADKVGAVTSWQRLATFRDGNTDGQAVLSARPRASVSLDDLLSKVRADWNKSADRLRVGSMRKVEPSPAQTVGSVVVDGSFVRKPKAPAAKPGEPTPPPPPPVTYRVQATYFLGSGYEYLLYATGQQTHWSRLRGPLAALRNSVRLEGKGDDRPRGEGVFRDDSHGYVCKYPKDYTVVVPQRGTHLVQFEGLAGTDAVIGVYAFPWNEGIERDADRLIAYYQGDMAGEASMRRTEVGGNEAIEVTARATVGGQERTFLLAILKRDDKCFRLRASMPTAAESEGTRTFRMFLATFQFRR